MTGGAAVPYGSGMDSVQPAGESARPADVPVGDPAKSSGFDPGIPARSADEAPAAARVPGPLDEMTARPLRTLITAKLLAMVLLGVVAIAAGILLAPQVGTGLGLAPEVAATVTSIEPLPAEDNAVGSGCTRERVHVSWGDGHSGTFITCGVADADADANPSALPVDVGDTIGVHAVAGWTAVVIGSRVPNVILVVVLLGVLALSVVGAVRYVRERRVIAELARHPSPAAGLAATRIGFGMAFDALSLGKGKRAMLQMRFDDPSLRPLRLQIPGASAEAMHWRTATIHPAGHTRKGNPSGPYVLETSSGGTLLAAGRQLRRRSGAPDDHA